VLDVEPLAVELVLLVLGLVLLLFREIAGREIVER